MQKSNSHTSAQAHLLPGHPQRAGSLAPLLALLLIIWQVLIIGGITCPKCGGPLGDNGIVMESSGASVFVIDQSIHYATCLKCGQVMVVGVRYEK